MSTGEAPHVTGRLHWPVNLRDAIRFELTGQMPVDVAALIEQVRRDAYTRGQIDGMARIAANVADIEILGHGWRNRARKTAAQWLTERLATFERCADDLAKRLGRPDGWRYRGGPVDFDTGLPTERRPA